MKKSTFIEYIRTRNFREMFITEMGWNNYHGQADLPPVIVDDVQYDFKTIAEKSGFQILLCNVSVIPTASTCKRIDVKLRRSANDYIAIFVQTGTEHHQWITPVRQVEKRDIVTIEYENADKADFLFSKIEDLSFDFDEVTTIVDVKQRVHSTFAVNSEKITKDFYAGFKKEHDAFVKFITGIDDEITDLKKNRNKQWYTSVMLNRLMFCYFIQKKGFLDGNVNYLRDKLHWCQEQKGAGHFFKSFYLQFLIHLFHDGLNAPQHNREFEQVYGKIPYLNGGMFDSHQIEIEYSDIDIADEAFERLFEFFDKWRWHLDTRISASGKDINPDVLGYIFEQYINDRAQMGAYYTKEDITEYIGRNNILPFLFDKVRMGSENTNTMFAPDGFIWTLLKTNAEKYIFQATKHGYSSDWLTKIPQNIARGVETTQPDLISRRSLWNTSSHESFGLPNEIWRDTIERFQRCDRLIEDLKNGRVTDINDFITENLDIRLFVQDILEQTDSPSLVGDFYHELQQVTILDPTCGSGAFLFAAMNILEPLYEICISRMEDFHSRNAELFNDELSEISQKYRSNIQYFIYKSIILRNLYGVDIMAEAVEIAKLRLFLKMVAVVDVDSRAKNLGLDPLPDIDFNIRCGNTLVGYATEEEIIDGASADLFTQAEFKERVENEMQEVAKAYNAFRSIQLSQHDDLSAFKKAKSTLKTKLTAFTELLNEQMFSQSRCADFDSWISKSQPFHWIAEYYQIIHGKGGFDVIIGNPPYVEYSKVRKDYTIDGIECIDSGNLYAYVIERSIGISHPGSRNGMIIQMSAFCTPRMSSFQDVYFRSAKYSAVAFFDDRPGKLFDNLQHIRVAIPMMEIGEPSGIIATTGYNKFYSANRDKVFETISYFKSSTSRRDFSVIKIRSAIEESIMEKVWAQRRSIQSYESEAKNENYVYYGYGYGYFGKILNHRSYFWGETISESTGDKYYYIQDGYDKDIFVGLMNSSLFYWFYINYSDGHNFTKTVIGALPFEYDDSAELKRQVQRLMNDLDQKKGRKSCVYKTTGRVEYDEYYPKLSKSVIDSIDAVLASHYGFTDEELDFIINYDIKYRMGDELENHVSADE